MTGVLIHRYLLMPGAFSNIPITIDVNGLQHEKWSMPISTGEFNYLSDILPHIIYITPPLLRLSYFLVYYFLWFTL